MSSWNLNNLVESEKYHTLKDRTHDAEALAHRNAIFLRTLDDNLVGSLTTEVYTKAQI